MTNAVKSLGEVGQSIWLDYIRRSMTRSGELAARVDSEGLRGVTSNPSIFRSSMGGGDEYGDALTALAQDADRPTKDVYETLAIEDIQEACDALRSVYDSTEHADGFVSLEVSPRLSRDSAGTLAEAKRLWTAVDRPNLMIKVPGTVEGIVAIEQLIAEGINVNVTLIFARDAYEDIAQAYVRGLQARVAAGKPISDVSSVASFFVSRIDAEVDKRLDAIGSEQAVSLKGTIAVANAKVAYLSYQALCRTDAWQALAAKGARPQRLLWASTGTKNPAYSDVLYVEQLVGPDTVNTVPPKTLAAFLDHGKVAPTLTADVDQAHGQLDALEAVGVSLTDVTDVLLERGLVAFEDAMDDLLATVAVQQRKVRGARLNRIRGPLSTQLQAAVQEIATSWTDADNTKRIWAKDAKVWTDGPEARWLGWLDIIEAQLKDTAHLHAFAQDVNTTGFSDIVLLGMGGSSLCPDVLAKTFGSRSDRANLRIVDSTVPAQVQRMERSVDLSKTLFIVASKSGSTLEPTVLLEFFLDRARAALGDQAPQHFVAITDPGSKLEAFAKAQDFRTILYGVPEIGGRFSAFSNFGMVPAAGMGIDVDAFLAEAKLVVDGCRDADPFANPGVHLGLVMGAAAKLGRNKLHLLTSPGIGSFGAWVEQLVAESTGKHGQAIIPIDGETPRLKGNGDDRVFVYLRLASTPDPAQDKIAQAWRDAGESVVTIELDDIDALSQELFRWQFATAVAGSIMQLDPFDQPDVEASKIESRKLTTAYEEHGTLPELAVRFDSDGVRVHADDANAQALGKHDDLTGWLRAHLERLGAGDYFALLAYVDMNDAHERELQAVRNAVRRAKSVPTCLGFGPRFLHSTGQAYKGGPNSGVFVQVTADAQPLPIPGRKVDFGVVAAAQAAGDFQVLIDRERRALRVHLGTDVLGGLRQLRAAFELALS